MAVHIGFVGGGGIARHHADRLVASDRFSVDAVADIDHDARADFADAYDVPATYPDHGAMFAAEPALDVVAVTVPNAYHAECAVAALDHGFDTFVEKPLAATLDGAERIADAASDSEGRAFVGFMLPFDPPLAAVADRAANGRFGEIYDLSLTYVRRRGIPGLGGWFTDSDVAGGGVVVDIGPHLVHYALYVLGFPAVETVSADTGAHFGGPAYTCHEMYGPEGDGAAFDVEDSARAHLRTADGTTIHLDCAWASNRPKRKRVEVLGDEAGAVVPIDGGDPTIHGIDGEAFADTHLTPPDHDRCLAEWAYVADVIDDGRTHARNTVDEGLRVQRVLDAVYRSAEAGTEVELDGAGSVGDR